MPIIDGKVVRARYTSLKLDELSSVDNPAQPSARMLIMKRDDRDDIIDFVAKYVTSDDGVHSFSEVLRKNKFSDQIWPFTDALSQSIRSAVGDNELASYDRDARVTASVEKFLLAVRAISPATEKQLGELINKRDNDMSKTVEQLEGDVAKLTADNAALKAAKMEADDKAKLFEEELDETKKALTAATDEVLKIDDATEVRKSEVGDSQFKVMKALAQKAETAEFEKRAASEFGSVVGTGAEKGLVLKAAAQLDEATRKALEAIMISAEKMVGMSMQRVSGGYQPVVNKVASDSFMEKVSEIQKRDGITHTNALSKARRENPELFVEFNNPSVN